MPPAPQPGGHRKGQRAGQLFWCLMVKPAYLQTQRLNGTFNGLFQEDGSVYSREDYLAIAGADAASDLPRNSPPCPGGFWRTRSGKGRKRNNECSKAPYFADHHRRAAPGYHFRPRKPYSLPGLEHLITEILDMLKARV